MKKTLCFTDGDKNKRYFGNTKFCISNAEWKDACGWYVQIAGMSTAHTQTAPGQKMPLCFALSTPLIYIWKKSWGYSPERNSNR